MKNYYYNCDPSDEIVCLGYITDKVISGEQSPSDAPMVGYFDKQNHNVRAAVYISTDINLEGTTLQQIYENCVLHIRKNPDQIYIK